MLRKACNWQLCSQTAFFCECRSRTIPALKYRRLGDRRYNFIILKLEPIVTHPREYSSRYPGWAPESIWTPWRRGMFLAPARNRLSYRAPFFKCNL
jgi:hypothetical protein